MVLGLQGQSYRLCDVVYNYCAVRIPVIHGCERFISLLSSSIPYLKLDCCLLVQGYGLCEECGADRRLSVVVKLILDLVGLTAMSHWWEAEQVAIYLDESEDE